jgi:protein-S-isoprenylcysteine O-methyltransferase Ste14
MINLFRFLPHTKVAKIVLSGEPRHSKPFSNLLGAFNHFYILMEERKNIEKYDQEYKDYMKRTPRYLGLDKTS